MAVDARLPSVARMPRASVPVAPAEEEPLMYCGVGTESVREPEAEALLDPLMCAGVAASVPVIVKLSAWAPTLSLGLLADM